MKNTLVLLALVLFFLTSHLKSQTVYITENGKKYHSKNCALAKTGKKGIDLALAKKEGYEPCKACKVETEASVKDKPKEKVKVEKSKS